VPIQLKRRSRATISEMAIYLEGGIASQAITTTKNHNNFAAARLTSST